MARSIIIITMIIYFLPYVFGLKLGSCKVLQERFLLFVDSHKYLNGYQYSEFRNKYSEKYAEDEGWWLAEDYSNLRYPFFPILIGCTFLNYELFFGQSTYIDMGERLDLFPKH